MATIAERILQVIEEKEHGNKRQFALKVGVSAPYVTQITRDADIIPGKLVLDKIAVVYNVNREWLETGSGDPFPPKTLGDELGEIAAAAAKGNVEATREYFRKLGDNFTDAEILFLYEIFKRHFRD